MIITGVGPGPCRTGTVGVPPRFCGFTISFLMDFEIECWVPPDALLRLLLRTVVVVEVAVVVAAPGVAPPAAAALAAARA